MCSAVLALHGWQHQGNKTWQRWHKLILRSRNGTFLHFPEEAVQWALNSGRRRAREEGWGSSELHTCVAHGNRTDFSQPSCLVKSVRIDKTRQYISGVRSVLLKFGEHVLVRQEALRTLQKTIDLQKETLPYFWPRL